MKLSDLLPLVNLPDLIASRCGPDAVCGLTRERGGVICDPRPGHAERHPSFSVYRVGEAWRWKRHGGDGATGDAYGFLLALGDSPAQAREELARFAGVSLDPWTPSRERPTYAAPDPLQEARAVLERCAPLSEAELQRAHGLLASLTERDEAAHDLQRRGLFGYRGLQVDILRRDFRTRDGRLLAQAGSLAFFLTGPDGQPWGLKVRNPGDKAALDAAGLLRYVYRIAGHGAPAWCSPGYGQGDGVLLVEGELNGAAAARGLKVAGSSLDVQGLAGAGGTPFLQGLSGKTVFLYADHDEAGAACLERVGKLAHAAGAREVRVLAPLSGGDFCDLCGKLGAATFGSLLMERVDSADYWQTGITGKTGCQQKNVVQSEEKRLLANWQHISGWGGEDASGWGGTGGWGGSDRGGW